MPGKACCKTAVRLQPGWMTGHFPRVLPRVCKIDRPKRTVKNCKNLRERR